MNTIQELLRDPVFRHFHTICQIPHGSGHEERLAAHILKWARAKGWSARQDQAGNVLIRKPGSLSDSAATDTPLPVVMLQAHMDMVCVQPDGGTHNFLTDPIAWQIDGDNLSTGGKTTLGADDGIGVALALAALEAEHTPCPTLEVLLTTMEEEDLSGALGFAAEQMQADMLINLDHTREHEILCGCGGGMRADFTLPLTPEPLPEGWIGGRLSVSGLKGGHSGDDIDKGYGNAIVLLARLLDTLEAAHIPCRVCTLRGGSMRLAIPAYAETFLCFAADRREQVQRILASAAARFQQEFSAAPAPAVHFDFSPLPASGKGYAPAPIIQALALLPDGIDRMSDRYPGLVHTSANLGEVRVQDDVMEIVLEIRSASENAREWIGRKIDRLAAILGASCRFSFAYPAWEANPDGHLIGLCRQVHRDLYGTDPALLQVHSGLEVGCFTEKRPSLEAISIGPDLFHIHSVEESLSLSSVRRFYTYLLSLLSRICTEGTPAHV